MKSTQTRPLRGKLGPALFSVLALSLVWAACTKDATSEALPAAPAVDQAGAAKAAPAPAPTPAPTQVTPADSAGDVVATGKTVGGDDSYTVTVDAPDSVAAGGEGTVRVSVVPKKGWKMNHEFPTKLAVTAPAGVTVTNKAEQRVADAERFDDSGAVFAVKFKASEAGSKSFAAKFKFAVCTDATCDPKKEQLAWVVDVK
ncbi:MAG: hypothetical protein Tsb0020_42230 [Haliangiales bacterium]